MTVKSVALPEPELLFSHGRPLIDVAAMQLAPLIFVIWEEGFAFDIKSQEIQETLKRRWGGDATSSLSHPCVSPTSGGPSAGQYIGNVSQSICFLSTHIVPAF